MITSIFTDLPGDPSLDQMAVMISFGIIGFILSMFITPIYTHFAYRYKWWKVQKQVGLDGKKAKVFLKLHKAKHQRHFPTMAGLVFVASVTITTLLLNFDRNQTWLPLTALVGSALVGLIDDVLNIRGLGGGTAGLSSKLKMGLILIVGTLGAWYFYFKLGDSYTTLFVPFLDQLPGFDSSEINIGPWIMPLFVFIVAAAVNSVNFTDGLDGLAGGLNALSFAFFGIIAHMQGSHGIAAFCFTIVGSLLAYVWFNIPPARFMMGEIGSFALGASLGVVAMLTGAVLILPIIGMVYVLEALSVIAQTMSKRFFGRKLFKIAPLHHHFEALGWPESKVTMRFWLLGGVSGMLGLWVAMVSGLV